MFSYIIFIENHKYHIDKHNTKHLNMNNIKIAKFDDFIAESVQRDTVINIAAGKVKEKYGNTIDSFIHSVETQGEKDIEDYIIKVVKSRVERIAAEEKVQTGSEYVVDYDTLLNGYISWVIVKMQLKENKNK